MPKKENNNNSSFEIQLSKAKEIVRKLESGDCDLDEMLTLYKQGIDSLKFCNQKLNEFEDKITVINKDVNNQLNQNDLE
tara:strand:+ start:210 stop:446 length:237 start_codon:yes stop_codon:yes gene_type:complete